MKTLWVLLTVLAFLGGCFASLRPIWSIEEKGWIKDVGVSIPGYFPLLGHGEKESGTYRVIYFRDLAGGRPVTQVSEADLDDINRQLDATVSSTPSKYPYFQILSRHGHSLDVSLEVPTVRDSRTKGWYRIDGGAITPQRIMTYGPGFAFVVMPFILLAGVISAILFRLATRRIRNKLPNHTHSQCSDSGIG